MPSVRRVSLVSGRQQAVELRPEGGIVLRVDVGALELVEGGKEKLGDELAAVLAEVGIEQHDGDSFFEFGSVKFSVFGFRVCVGVIPARRPRRGPEGADP